MSTILITGGSGLIGRHLTEHLRAQGHSVRHLGRTPGERNGVRTFRWHIREGHVEEGALVGVEHIVHLAGAGIADSRWSEARVNELIASRADSAQLLLRKAGEQGIRPKSFVSASGIGYYGAMTTTHVFSETDPAASDTIGRISRVWEEAVDEWTQVTRVVKLRTPVVLAPDGGALKRLSLPVKWGVGTALGNGEQWMPWVHISDLVRAYAMAMADERLSGAYNVCASEQPTNKEMMRAVADVLNKPFFLPSVPAFLLKLALGEMSTILLEGSKVSNVKLLGTGFTFRYNDLHGALSDCLEPTSVAPFQ